MKKTIDDLINHCENILRGEWKYVYGAKGKRLSKEQKKICNKNKAKN